jgi:AcrR family transcriptional regulator
VKNTQSRRVRNRTSGRNRPETLDRRVQRTKTALHDALIGLAREKPYPSIVVKEILHRANVGRSTFYTHFRDKDDLLESGVQEILRSIQAQPRAGNAIERVVAFSCPLLEHIDGHRHAAGPSMKREGRLIMHEHMQHVLDRFIADELAMTPPGGSVRIPADLVARHVASTFVLVLNWWVESDLALSPEDVDTCFRGLVLPVLAKLFTQIG